MMNKHIRNHKAALIPFFVLGLVVFLPLTALVIDTSYISLVKTKLDSAAESAVLSGSQEYFRNMGDGGLAVNKTLNTFKKNVTGDNTVTNYYSSTGAGSPTTLTHMITFSSGLVALFKNTPIEVTVTTDLNRGKITVDAVSTIVPYIIGSNIAISSSKEAELPPYDIAFVIDLSGSMRYASLKTYVGEGWRRPAGGGSWVWHTDLLLYQSDYSYWGYGHTIIANGYETYIYRVTDAVINDPDFDINRNEKFDDAVDMFVNDPNRGYVINSGLMISGKRRTELTGLTISELAAYTPSGNITSEDVAFANDSFSWHTSDITQYFSHAEPHVEPHGGSAAGLAAFVNTVKTYGSAALKLSLVTFDSTSTAYDRYDTFYDCDVEANNSCRYIRSKKPFYGLTTAPYFDNIAESLAVDYNSGSGTYSSPFQVDSWPYGGTNIVAGLNIAESEINTNGRTNAEKVIILFTDGAPTYHTFSQLGTEVSSLTAAGYRVHSVVLTLSVSQTDVNNFQYQLETVGMAEPVIFISDPTQLTNAFLSIAGDLGLRLVK